MNNNQFNPNFNYSTQIGGTALKFNLTNILYAAAGILTLIAYIIKVTQDEDGVAVIVPILFSLCLIAMGALKAFGTIKLGAPVAFGATILFFVLIKGTGYQFSAANFSLADVALFAFMLFVGRYYLNTVLNIANEENANWKPGFYAGLAVAVTYGAIILHDMLFTSLFNELVSVEFILYYFFERLAFVALAAAVAFNYQDLNKPAVPQYAAPQYTQAQYTQPVAPQYTQPVAPQYAQPAQPQYGQPVPPAAPQYGQPVPPAAPQYNYPGQQ